MTGSAPYESVPIPQLMLDARGSYGDLARQALTEAGCDDVPDQGGFVLAGLDETEFTPQAEAVAGLRRSKQRSSQLIDTLVLRGYLERRNDPDDRRRMSVRLTERGRIASAAIQAAVDTIDAELARRLTLEELHGLRAGLAALADIRKQSGDERV
ncbi:MAG: MarR family transcriptional regulator [Solirubrobacteraceae bacterium]